MAEGKPRTAAEIVGEVNDLAHVLLRYIGTGYDAGSGHKFYASENPRSQKAWAAAVEAYEWMTGTEVHDALLEVEDVFQEADGEAFQREHVMAEVRDYLDRKLTELGSEDDFPNYAVYEMTLPAGHWRILNAVLAGAGAAARRPHGDGRALALTSLDAAVQALRSYQHGNTATDLAQEVADDCEATVAELKAR